MILNTLDQCFPKRTSLIPVKKYPLTKVEVPIKKKKEHSRANHLGKKKNDFQLTVTMDGTTCNFLKLKEPQSPRPKYRLQWLNDGSNGRTPIVFQFLLMIFS